METEVSLNVALMSLFMSVAVLFPLAMVVIGCALCRNLCRGNDGDEENQERQPLLSGQREGQETSRETIESEQVIRLRKELETPEFQGQQEVEQIPDVVRVDEQRTEGTVETNQPLLQTEPDILEPRPLRTTRLKAESDQKREQLPAGIQSAHEQPIVKEEQTETEQSTEKEELPGKEQSAEKEKQFPEKENVSERPTTAEQPAEIERLTEKEPSLKKEEVDKVEVSSIVRPDARQDMELAPGGGGDSEQLVRTLATDDKAAAGFWNESKSSPSKIPTDEMKVQSLSSSEAEQKPIVMTTAEAGQKVENEPAQTQNEPETEAMASSHEQQRENFPTEIEKEQGKVQEQPDKRKEEAEQEGTNGVAIKFDLIPTFHKTIRTRAAKKDGKPIFGLAVLHQELFIISQHSSDVEVYDSGTLDFKHQWQLVGLFDPVDIRSCDRNSCLYVFDWKGEANEIFRVDPSGKVLTKWSTGEDGGCLSVTPQANVILSSWDRNKLNEYTKDGQLVREIRLPSTVLDLRLAVQLTSGQFLVSYGENDDNEHVVCLIDDSGTVVKAFGGQKGSSDTQLYSPNYMAVTQSGYVIVADQNNKRVLLLGPSLEFKRVLVDEALGLRYPVRLDLDEKRGRLFVADNDYMDDENVWRDGRVLTFDFRTLSSP